MSDERIVVTTEMLYAGYDRLTAEFGATSLLCEVGVNDLEAVYIAMRSLEPPQSPEPAPPSSLPGQP